MEDEAKNEILSAINSFSTDVDKRFSNLEGRFGNLEKTVNNLPDKAYLSSKLADIEGVVVTRQRKQEDKTNLILEVLEKFKVVPKEELEAIRAIHVFPSPPEV